MNKGQSIKITKIKFITRKFEGNRWFLQNQWFRHQVDLSGWLQNLNSIKKLKFDSGIRLVVFVWVIFVWVI